MNLLLEVSKEKLEETFPKACQFDSESTRGGIRRDQFTHEFRFLSACLPSILSMFTQQ